MIFTIIFYIFHFKSNDIEMTKIICLPKVIPRAWSFQEPDHSKSLVIPRAWSFQGHSVSEVRQLDIFIKSSNKKKF